MRLLLLFHLFCSPIFAEDYIENTKDLEENTSIVYVVKGKPVTLECNTNNDQPYYTCKWNRPGNSEICAMFNPDLNKNCPVEVTSEEGSNIQGSID